MTRRLMTSGRLYLQPAQDQLGVFSRDRDDATHSGEFEMQAMAVAATALNAGEVNDERPVAPGQGGFVNQIDQALQAGSNQV